MTVLTSSRSAFDSAAIEFTIYRIQLAIPSVPGARTINKQPRNSQLPFQTSVLKPWPDKRDVVDTPCKNRWSDYTFDLGPFALDAESANRLPIYDDPYAGTLRRSIPTSSYDM